MEISQPLISQAQAPSGTSSSLQTSVNLFKSFIGIGFLALPYCFKQSGVLLSSIFMFPIIFLCIYTVFKTVDLVRLKSKEEISYRELYGEYLGQTAMKLFDFCMAFNYFGIGVTYVIFFIDFFENAFGTTGLLYSLMYAGIALVVIIPLSVIRSLEIFTKYSFIANIITMVVLITLMQYPIVRFEAENVENLSDIKEVPGLLGVALFAFLSPGLVLPIHNAMKEKQMFKPVFTVVLMLVFVLYLVFALVCCYGFRAEDITQNMLKAFGNISSGFLFVQSLYALVLIISYPLQMRPLFEVIESLDRVKEFILKEGGGWLRRNSVRVGVSVLIMPFGIFVAKFSDFVNLLGGLCFFLIQFIFPLWAFNVCKGKTISSFEWGINWILVGLSCLAVGLSTYSSIWSFIYR